MNLLRIGVDVSFEHFNRINIFFIDIGSMVKKLRKHFTNWLYHTDILLHERNEVLQFVSNKLRNWQLKWGQKIMYTFAVWYIWCITHISHFILKNSLTLNQRSEDFLDKQFIFLPNCEPYEHWPFNQRHWLSEKFPL